VRAGSQEEIPEVQNEKVMRPRKIFCRGVLRQKMRFKCGKYAHALVAPASRRHFCNAQRSKNCRRDAGATTQREHVKGRGDNPPIKIEVRKKITAYR
jgi:hypothetical protein